MKFQLEKYTGPASKHICPSCGRRSFKRYICTDSACGSGNRFASTLAPGDILDPSCGRCDHEQSCGYHLTPRDFFATHPSADSFRDSICRPISRPIRWSNALNGRSEETGRGGALDYSLVTQSLSTRSSFCHFLRTLLADEQRFLAICQLYHLGATRDGAVIFWQIDRDNRVHTGKVMHYTSDGHRTGNPNWIHAILRSRNMLQPDWQLNQCLFGEHLLSMPPKPICLVESEKSAVICAAFYPQYIWLATGGCKGLSAEKLYPLAGCRVIIYPDAGCLNEWQHKLQTMARNIDYSLVEDLEKYPPNTDIADIIIADICGTPLPTAERDVTVPEDSSSVPSAPAGTHSPLQILAELRAANPALIQLEQALDLKLEQPS